MSASEFDAEFKTRRAAITVPRVSIWTQGRPRSRNESCNIRGTYAIFMRFSCDGLHVRAVTNLSLQSQTITVDRQMRRYDVTRFSFINEMDRPGAGPWRVINHSDRASHAAAVQVPIGLEDQLEDVVDLVRWKAVYNRGVKDVDIVESGEIPASALELATQKRTELSERLPRVKNTAVQPLLDGVCAYLASPSERQVVAHDTVQSAGCTTSRGSLKKGQFIFHGRSGMRIKVPKLVRVHRNEMEDIESIGPGEICAIFGVECATGDTFTDGTTNYSMTSMFVPDPVISLAIKPVGTETPNFSRALNRFQKEDPTFRVHIDHESKETIISGMGELHLEIYVERMKREYGVACTTGRPQVAFRETVTERADFAYTHKKQTGGAGQYARVIGHVEPMEMDAELGKDTEFESVVMGGNVPSNYIPAVEKGFFEALEKGTLSGNPISGVRMVLRDGAFHAVDSSELAFRLAAIGAFREAYLKTKPVILEPIMTVEVVAPVEFQSAVIGGLNARRGTIIDSEVREDEFTAVAEVALNDMFGYSSQLRGATQGKGEFSMEYKNHMPVLPNVQVELQDAYRKSLPHNKK
ncbi:hypothetical protein EDB84DRAFT_1678395 [Lactarius hengduanensis]|nr:hypothetical protein EDB84DRAFT_1678395 [Lactarius hengduanensis]